MDEQAKNLPEVLTEEHSIPDVTPAVEKLQDQVADIKADPVQGGVSQRQHQAVEEDIQRNTKAIAEIKATEITPTQHTDVLSQIDALRKSVDDASGQAAQRIADAAAKAVEAIAEAAATAAVKVTGTADVAAGEVQATYTDKPLPSQTTEQEDITTQNQRLLLLIGTGTTAAISALIVMGGVGLAVYLAAVGQSSEYPPVLTAAMSFVLGFYLKGNSTTIPVVPSFQSRAGGGPVKAGQTVLVGERGSELITAVRDSHVTPHDPKDAAK